MSTEGLALSARLEKMSDAELSNLIAPGEAVSG
jgi:hypothetical protein